MPVTLVLVLAGHSSTELGGQVIVGGVVSRTVMVWTQLAVLPQASVAVQVRAMSLVAPQLLVTESLKLRVTKPQPSWAAATPVALVLVLAGHSSTRFGGQVMTGGVVSRTVMVWMQRELLPQASVAIQVRAMTLVAPQLVVIESLKLTLTAPQPSWAVATPVALVSVSAGHSSTRFGGQVMTGGVVSRTVMVWMQLLLMPQASVAVQVRAMTLVPPQLLVTESLKLMLTEPQPSRAVATPVKLVLVSAGHSSTTFVGQVMTGGVVSSTEIVCAQLLLLPQASVAVQVRVMTLLPPQ